MLDVSVQSGVPESTAADVLALFITDPPELSAAASALNERLQGRLRQLVEDGEIKGQLGHVALVHTRGELAAHRLALVGVGKPPKLDADSLRTAASRVVARLRGIGGGTIAWCLDPSLDLDPSQQARSLTEGTALASFDHGRWKTIEPRPKEIEALVLVSERTDELAELEAAAHRAARTCRWTNRCRELVDAPANELTPAELASAAESIANELAGLSCEVWGPEEIRAAKMGALDAVGRGSANPSRLITVRWEPEEAPDSPVLGLVGKAITFDTGGISIKPSARMADMKTDMGGGAAVVGAMGAIAELTMPIRVVGVVPAAENMPDGHAYRPGDIITARNGKTIEVTNTDAEGRLILADALTHCRELGATHMLDFATLTGACVVALGDFFAGLLGNDSDWVARVQAAAAASGDHAWELPLHDTYRRHIGSTFADFKNASDLRQAGPIYAASFLAEFVGEGPWAHLDIAGTAYLDRTRGDYFTGAGATGYGVRLAAELASALAAADA